MCSLYYFSRRVVTTLQFLNSVEWRRKFWYEISILQTWLLTIFFAIPTWTSLFLGLNVDLRRQVEASYSLSRRADHGPRRKGIRSSPWDSTGTTLIVRPWRSSSPSSSSASFASISLTLQFAIRRTVPWLLTGTDVDRVSGDILLSVWIGTQADDAFPKAWSSVAPFLSHTRCSRTTSLPICCLTALEIRVKAQLGFQSARTRQGSRPHPS